MQTSAVIPPSSLALFGKIVFNLARFALLSLLFFAIFAFGSGLVVPFLPVTPAEPGPVDQLTGVAIVSVACTLVIVLMIESSAQNPERGHLTQHS